MSGKGKDLGWVDGTDWDYDNFHSGKLIIHLDIILQRLSGFPMPGLGDFLAMDTSISAGQWMNIDCAAQLPVACIREGGLY